MVDELNISYNYDWILKAPHFTLKVLVGFFTSKTSQTLQAWEGQHRRAVEKGSADSSHTAKTRFKQRGHSSSDIRFIAIEQVKGRFEGDEDTQASMRESLD